MDVDLKYITLLVQIIVYVGGLVTLYWRLKMSISRRPIYEKVEDMIDDRAVNKDDFDDKVKKVVDDRSVSKVAFEKLKGDVASIMTTQKEVKQLLESLIIKITDK